MTQIMTHFQEKEFFKKNRPKEKDHRQENSGSAGKIHIPVMKEEVLRFLSPEKNKTYVDGTFGVGGYSEAILERTPCKVIAFDCDPDAEKYAKILKEKFQERFQFIQGNFSQMEPSLRQRGISEVQGVVFDLGVSSPQIDQGERGFSFQKEGPLDMRMSRQGSSAADAVNTLSESMLADIFYYYGDETKSRRVSRAILKYRAEKLFQTTQDLAQVVHSVLGQKSGKIDSATRVFQALRIYVNDELGSLKKGLEGTLKILASGGRLVVVTFHSLEDRIVKEFLNINSGKNTQSWSRHSPLPPQKSEGPSLELLTRKAVVPSSLEVLQNPRSRSAKLRAALRLSFPLFFFLGGS